MICHSERSEESRLSHTMPLIPGMYLFWSVLIPNIQVENEILHYVQNDKGDWVRFINQVFLDGF